MLIHDKAQLGWPLRKFRPQMLLAEVVDVVLDVHDLRDFNDRYSVSTFTSLQ